MLTMTLSLTEKLENNKLCKFLLAY